MAFANPGIQQKATRYQTLQRGWYCSGALFALAYSVIWMRSNWLGEIEAQYHGIFGDGLIILIPLVFVGFYLLLSLPISFMSGFILPRKYRLSRETLFLWGIKTFLGYFISFAKYFILIIFFYFIADKITIGSLIIGWIFFIVFSFINSSAFVNQFFIKKYPLKSEYPDLEIELLAMANAINIKISEIFIYESNDIFDFNIFYIRGSKSRSPKILIGKQLIDELGVKEIKSLIAHELGHAAIPPGRGFGFLWLAYLSGAVILLPAFSRLFMNSFGYQSKYSIIPVLFFVLFMFQILTAVITNIISRKREEMADARAVEILNAPEEFISALVRIGDKRLLEFSPSPFAEFWFYTHPSTEKRIAHIMAKSESLAKKNQ